MVTEVDPANHQTEWGPDTFRSRNICEEAGYIIFSLDLLCRIVWKFLEADGWCLAPTGLSASWPGQNTVRYSHCPNLDKHFEKTNFASRLSNYWKVSLNYAMLMKQNLNSYSKRMHFLYINSNIELLLITKLDSWTYLLGKVTFTLSGLHLFRIVMNKQVFSDFIKDHKNILNIFLDSRWFSMFLEDRLTHTISPDIHRIFYITLLQ